MSRSDAFVRAEEAGAAECAALLRSHLRNYFDTLSDPVVVEILRRLSVPELLRTGANIFGRLQLR